MKQEYALKEYVEDNNYGKVIEGTSEILTNCNLKGADAENKISTLFGSLDVFKQCVEDMTDNHTRYFYHTGSSDNCAEIVGLAWRTTAHDSWELDFLYNYWTSNICYTKKVVLQIGSAPEDRTAIIDDISTDSVLDSKYDSKYLQSASHYWSNASEATRYLRIGYLPTVEAVSNGTGKVVFEVAGIGNLGSNEETYSICSFSTRGSIKSKAVTLIGEYQTSIGTVALDDRVEVWVWCGSYSGTTNIRIISSAAFTVDWLEQQTRPDGLEDGEYDGWGTIKVNDIVHPTGQYLYLGNSGNDAWVLSQDICSKDSAGDGIWSIRTNGNAQFQRVASVGGFYKESDKRLKSNIQPLNHTIEQICAIPTDKFVMNGHIQIGTIAQDLENIVPEIVSEDYKLASEVSNKEEFEIIERKDKERVEEYIKVKKVEYEMLGVLAIEGVKLLKEEIDRLKKQIKELKDGIDK